MSQDKRLEFTARAFKEIYRALVDIYGDNDEGYKHATLLVLYAVVADGRFDRREFEIMKPMLGSMFEGNMDYDRAKAIIQNTIDDEDNIGAIEYVLKIKGRLIDHDEELLGSFRMLMLSVCAIDGCISRDERKWLWEVL
ncbi:MAG: TerB family tellurite resistance protein [Candidatus Methanomethylophilaceae archaeon]|nr:TerB family tellurite resistance protein [Candidatus Methanomethylophilaceae archaeon]